MYAPQQLRAKNKQQLSLKKIPQILLGLGALLRQRNPHDKEALAVSSTKQFH